MARLDPRDLDAIAERVRQELDKEQTARSIWTTHPIVLDPRDAFGPRRTPSNLVEHAAGILHDDKGKPIKGEDGGHVSPAGYVSGVRYDPRGIEDVDKMTQEA